MSETPTQHTLGQVDVERKTLRYAGIWSRFLALNVDYVLISLGAMLAMSLLEYGSGLNLAPEFVFSEDTNVLTQLGEHYRAHSTEVAAQSLVWLLVMISYFLYYVGGKWQASPGKRLLKIYIVGDKGKPLTHSKVFQRYFALIWWAYAATLMTMGDLDIQSIWAVTLTIQVIISTVMLIMTREGITLHDKFAHTRVVKGKAEV